MGTRWWTPLCRPTFLISNNLVVLGYPAACCPWQDLLKGQDKEIFDPLVFLVNRTRRVPKRQEKLWSILVSIWLSCFITPQSKSPGVNTRFFKYIHRLLEKQCHKNKYRVLYYNLGPIQSTFKETIFFPVIYPTTNRQYFNPLLSFAKIMLGYNYCNGW